MCPPTSSFPSEQPQRSGPSGPRSAGSGVSGSSGSLIIDCDECALQGTEACGDCIVTFLCGVDSDSPVVIDLAEVRAMRTLGDAGLAPPLRHRRSAVRA